MSSMLQSELDRVAGVAVSHGRDDPSLDVFLTFVGALEPPPAAAALKPAAQRVGKLRLAQALDRPGERRLGACRLLAAAAPEWPRLVAPPPEPVLDVAERLPDTVAEAPAEETGRRLPELFETLLRAIRVAVSLLLGL